VFDKVVGKEYVLKGKKTEELLEILKKSPIKKMVFSDYLSQAIYNISQIMGIKNIILTGKLSKLYDCIDKELKNSLIAKNITSQVICKSELGEFSAEIGVAINAYYEKYNIPLEWKY